MRFGGPFSMLRDLPAWICKLPGWADMRLSDKQYGNFIMGLCGTVSLTGEAFKRCGIQ